MRKNKINLLIILVLSIVFQSCNPTKTASVSDGCISDFRITISKTTPNPESISFVIVSTNTKTIQSISQSPETEILISGGFFDDSSFQFTDPRLPVFRADSFAVKSSSSFFWNKTQTELDSIAKQNLDSIKISIINKDKKWIFAKCRD